MNWEKLKCLEGKKAYKVHKFKNCKRTHLVTQCIHIYILKVNEGDKTVLASVGGAPAKTYTGREYSWWRDKPEEDGHTIIKSPNR